MRKDDVERYLWSPQMVWGRPGGVLTAAGAAECHMGCPIRPMKGEQGHPEAPSPLVKRLTDESSFTEITNMTVAKHNYRYQWKLAAPWRCLTASETDEDTTTHTWLHCYLCKTRRLISSYLYSPAAFLLSSMSSSFTCHAKCTSHPPFYQRRVSSDRFFQNKAVNPLIRPNFQPPPSSSLLWPSFCLGPF